MRIIMTALAPLECRQCGGGGGWSGGVPRESPSGWGWVLPSGPKGAPWEWNLRDLDVVAGASLAPSVRGGGGGSGGVPRESPSGWGWVLPSGPKGAPWEWNLRYLDVVAGASLAPSVRGGGGGQGGFLGSRPQDGAGSYRVAPRVLLGNGT